MSAIFDFSSLITVILLFICTCTYVRAMRSTIFDENVPTEDEQSVDMNQPKRRGGVRGICWKASRIGERVSPYVSISLVAMACHILFFK
ncbi:hypothetical protein CTAYLR_001488 [Chrysophaeum taylorii]|uniref:Protein kish n=1 Tax=Chrysophaeum taylorii TaxID=2483200 RepID=A0AAD7UF88_9STRA|nr:hypothetical protein CTAYLR_001488 [Chrysophaeum taylorii]